MKLLIDIPEHIYEHAKEMTEDSRDEGEAMRAIANGSQQESCSEKPNKWMNEARRWKRRYLDLKQQARWIPVSERLPEKGTRVLTSWIYVPTGTKYIEIAERYGNDDNYTFCGDTDEYKMNRKDHEVKAWMPLPEPYKAESEAQE